MKIGKDRMWTHRDGEALLGSVTISELGRVIADEINKHIEVQNEMAEAIKGFTDCGQPLVVDEYLLDEVLEVVNCQRCPCGNYCPEHNVYRREDCARAKKMYLLGKLENHAADTIADTEEE